MAWSVEEITKDMRRLLDEGEFRDGDQFYTHDQLMDRYGRPYHGTIQEALEPLEGEGRLHARQGKGTFVGPRPPAGV